MRGEQVFSDLFNNGHGFFQTPYKAYWSKIAGTFPFSSRFAVSVPKRLFKRAVKRNLLKRRTRESFRTNKQILNAAVNDGGQVHLLVIYTSAKLLPSTELEEAMKKILQHIAQQYAKSA